MIDSRSQKKRHRIDGFGRIVQVRKKAIQEIIIWIHDIIQYDDDFNEDNGKNVIYQLFQFISDIINSNTGNLLIHFVYNNEAEIHLPIPVYSYIRPDMRTQFILRVLLSLGRFSTEIYCNMQLFTIHFDIQI